VREWDYNSRMASTGQSTEQARQPQDVDAIPTLAWSARPDGSAEFLNRRWLDYTGLSAGEASDWGWTGAIHTEDRDQLLDSWRRLLASGEPGEMEARLRRHDGDYRWFLFRVEPARDNHGNIFKWCGANTDIEDRKRAEALLAAEKRTLEMIANGACLKDILERLCETIDAQASKIKSAVMLMDADGIHLRHAAGPRLPKGWAETITPLKIGPCVGSCGTAASLKQRVIVSDIATDPLWADYRDLALGYGLRAAWSQPLLSKNQEVLGTFCLYYAEPRSPSETDLRLIEGADHIAVIAVEGERSQAKLRQDEEELRRIVDLIPQTIVVLNPDGRAIYANRAVLEYTRLSLDEIRSDGFRARVFHPDDAERLREERLAGLSGSTPFENEQRALGKDGTYRWFLIRYNPLLDESGKVVRWYATGTDIDERVKAEERTRNENLALREQIDRDSMFEDIVGSSEPLRQVLRQVAKVASSDSTVLILGETGTGKELIARAIHKRSHRAERAFIAVNCAAIPPSLMASELFGHEKGAFTGAVQRRLGRFESANGGTIFLDEVGDLPPEIQIGLLRVLQEREIERVGSNGTIPVDVRVLAATHRDLDILVAEGRFREDLLYRLRVVPIEMPALRERADDIPLLVDYFIGRIGKKIGKRFRAVDEQTAELFKTYHWPGNVRELQNVIERTLILSEGETFSVDKRWLKWQGPQVNGPPVQLDGALQRQEKEMIEAALAQTRGRISGPGGAAARLGLPRATLDARIRRLGINKYQFKVQR
ncbi:MAG: sigma 54-interacting transcriptional regulator, partial [Candidatus Acidiferrales bacterium]